MSVAKECPLCGGSMTVRRTETVVQTPGAAKVTQRRDAEWVCPDCDYFEELEPEDTERD